MFYYKRLRCSEPSYNKLTNLLNYNDLKLNSCENGEYEICGSGENIYFYIFI